MTRYLWINDWRSIFLWTQVWRLWWVFSFRRCFRIGRGNLRPRCLPAKWRSWTVLSSCSSWRGLTAGSSRHVPWLVGGTCAPSPTLAPRILLTREIMLNTLLFIYRYWCIQTYYLVTLKNVNWFINLFIHIWRQGMNASPRKMLLVTWVGDIKRTLHLYVTF